MHLTHIGAIRKYEVPEYCGQTFYSNVQSPSFATQKAELEVKTGEHLSLENIMSHMMKAKRIWIEVEKVKGKR